jgi:hypothetical protein
VTQNLYDVLKRAQPGGPESWLGLEDKIWIDAICINQSSLDERSAQVRLMAEIYRAARTVIVWLGEGEHRETQYAIELLKRISAAPTKKLNDLKKLPIHDPRTSEVLGEYGGSIDHWRSLKRMFSRTWFSRIWIIQEVAFAKSITVLCGRYLLLWEDCVKACEFLSYSVGNDLQAPSTIPYAGSNAEILSNIQVSDPTNLLDILVMTRSFEASDPRDKIFAILGLATLGRNQLSATELIRVDYELTPAEVFLETIWVIIKNSKDLNFLAEVEDPHLRNITDLPTWVPDFSSVDRPSIYYQSLHFNADGGLKRSLRSLSDPCLLSSAAYRLGEVVYTASLGLNEPFIDYFPRMLIPLFELSPIYATGEDRLEVLWRTMIQNGMDWVSPAAPDTALDFRDWILSNIAEAVIKGGNSLFVRERIDQVITQLETYSQTEPTGIMPSQHDVIWTVSWSRSETRLDFCESSAQETVLMFKSHDSLAVGPLRSFRTAQQLLDVFISSATEGSLGQPIPDFPMRERV